MPVFVADEIVTAAKMNELDNRYYGKAITTTGQGSITTTVDLTGLSVAVTVPADRLIRISGFVSIGADAADNTIRVGIWDSTTELGSWDLNSSVANIRYGVFPSVLLDPGVSETYRIRAGRVSGAGTVATGSSATRPSYLIVEDMGAV